MEENVEPAVPEQPSPPSLSEWFGIWIKAVTKPSEDTYVEIARRADLKTAYIWLAIITLIWTLYVLFYIGVFLLFFLALCFGPQGNCIESGAMASVLGISSGCLAGYIVGVLAMLSGMTALSNTVARAFGGVGDFRRLVYCFAAYSIPTSIAGMVLGALTMIPFANIVVIPIGLALAIYWIVINVIAIKAVHQIEIWQAVVSSVVIYALGLVIVACVVIGVLVLIDPSIVRVFSNVIEGILGY